MKEEINKFYDLETWQRAHSLTIETYKATNKFPKEELYGIVNQLRRAVSSIGANIAEGFSRYHFKDKVKFYYQARGSVAEVQNFLLLAKDLEFVSNEECSELGQKANEVQQLINGLIRSIDNQRQSHN